MNPPFPEPTPLRVMGFGVGSFTQAVLQILKENGASVSAYLTRAYGHYPPSLAGAVYDAQLHPNPAPLLKELGVHFVIPMSIDWAQQSWRDALLASGVPILCPVGDALLLERDRDYARQLCQKFSIPFPAAYLARNRLEAAAIVEAKQRPFVFKNPLCSPTSPIHTVVCETVEDTQSWLERLDYAEGAFLQEYMGRAEAGHIALVSGGEIYSLITNQEYKRAFDGNMGIVAGAPLGGLVERDPEDRYGLAKELLHPLIPWFRQTNFHGPVQVTAIRRDQKWRVLEYNVRFGVTCGPMLLRLLQNPLETLWAAANNRKLDPRFRPNLQYGCSITLAGYGYPYVQIKGPDAPVELKGPITCDLWWNEVAPGAGRGLKATGHRLADVVAFGATLAEAIDKAYANIRLLRCLGSYYRKDIGQSLWPPGSE